jgi:RimJ/RimL family protein N-acetyltransferase
MTQQLTFHKLPTQALQSLIDCNLEQASQQVGVKLNSFFITDDAVWLWNYRLNQVRKDSRTLDWIAQVVAVDSTAIGHAGFHGPPDEAGMVEVAYSVVPAYRGKRYAKIMLAELIKRAGSELTVKTVGASIRPDNVASLATIRSFGFVQIGEQWDDIDGLEFVFELAVNSMTPQPS